MCIVDAVFIMWVIGAAMLGWFGMKSWINYKKGKKSTNGKPTKISNDKPTSLE